MEDGKTQEGEAALRLAGVQLAADALRSSTPAEDDTSPNPHYSTA